MKYKKKTKDKTLKGIKVPFPKTKKDKVRYMMEFTKSVVKGRRAKEGNQQQSRFLKKVIESLTHPFYIIDANDYTIKLANSAAHFGKLSPKSTCYAITHKRCEPCKEAGHPCTLEMMKKTRKPVTVEHIHYDKDGNARNVEVHGYPVFDNQGNIIEMIEYCLDITERKQTEEALKASELNYHEIFNSANDAIFIHDTESGTILDANQRVHEMFGYTPEEIKQLKVEDISFGKTPYSQREVVQLTQKAARGKPQIFEWMAKDKDGRLFWVEVNLKCVTLEGKNRILATIRDITERKRTEEEIQRSYHIQTILNILLGVSLQDISQQEMLEHTIDLITSIPWISLESRGAIFLVEDDPNILVLKAQRGLAEPLQRMCARLPFNKCLCGKAAKEKKVLFADSIDEHHENRYKSISNHGHYCIPIMSSTKEVLGVFNLYVRVGHAYDKREVEFLTAVAHTLAGIIERKHAEEDLRKSKERFQQVVENAQEWVWEVDVNGLYTYASPIVEKILGYKTEEVVGKKYFYDFFHPDVRRKMKKTAFEVFARRDPFFEFINCNIHRNGKTVWLSTSGIPLFNEKKDFIGYRGVDTDITGLKQAEEQQKAITKGLHAVVEIAEELIMCTDVDILFKRAVELARDKLRLERCAIFVDDDGYMRGTYGTDRHGCTTDEYNQRFPKNKEWEERSRLLKPDDPRWFVVSEPLLEWNGEKTIDIGEGEIVITPIQSIHRSIGIFVSDNAISREPFDSVRQHAVAVLCSLLGDIIERKRVERRLEIINKEFLKTNKRLRQLVLRDSHTGLYNHRYLSEVIEREFYRARRYAHPLSVIMLDIDYFKSINDVYSHQFGDLVLKQFARQIKKMIRVYDVAIRFGGEEFIIVSPGTDMSTALVLAQRLLDDINLYSFGTKKQSVKLKVSSAVASYPEDNAARGMDLVSIADKALNKVKEDGGNRVYSSKELTREVFLISKEDEQNVDAKVLKGKIDKLTKRANQGLMEAVFAFAKTIEVKDHYTAEHAERSVQYAINIAQTLNLSKRRIERIKQAAILHDLGKIGVSERVLLKKARLTREEFEEVKKHPQIAADIIRPIHVLHDIIPSVLYHHERWDGGGYPAGLRGEEIPLDARIVAIADTYQALISDRPYRGAYPKDEAIKIIKEGSGTHFDPRIINMLSSSLLRERQ